MNESIDVRKLQVALLTRGEGVILFALWGCLEVCIALFSIDEYMPDISNYVERWFVYSIVFIICIILGAANLWINIYIGRAAMRFSHGAPLVKKPIVVTGLYTGLCILATVTTLIYGYDEVFKVYDIFSAVVDCFIIILHIEIIVFSLKLNKMEG